MYYFGNLYLSLPRQDGRRTGMPTSLSSLQKRRPRNIVEKLGALDLNGQPQIARSGMSL